MDQPIRVTLPMSEETVARLRAGDQVLICGPVYTARDAAHARIVQAIQSGEALPFDIRNQCIYYAGPTPARPGHVAGAVGPTTSSRMDGFTPIMLEHGLQSMIGKGKRSAAVREAIAVRHAVYFVAAGGVAALLGQCVQRADMVAYPELGPEAIRRYEVRDFPAIVGNDMYGGDVYELAAQDRERTKR